MKHCSILIGLLLALTAQEPAAAQSYEPDERTICGIARLRGCDIDGAIKHGLFETGLKPRFPKEINCRTIDEHWAISYTHKRNREAYHGGIDMPAPWGEAIIAAAAGTVVGKVTDPEQTQRGIELTIQHSPDDTGLPVWIYTSYGHFRSVPKVEVGQRVALGEVLGETGNSGRQTKIAGKKKQARRPAIHFAAFFAQSGHYTVIEGTHVVPVEGRWADPLALYRGTAPIDSHTMRGLPDTQKNVDVAVLLDSGELVPSGAKIVWPYKCSRSRLAPPPERYCNGVRCADRQPDRAEAKSGRGGCRNAADAAACREKRRGRDRRK